MDSGWDSWDGGSNWQAIDGAGESKFVFSLAGATMHPGTLLEHSMKYRIDQFSLNHKTIENLDITDRWR